MRECVIGVPVRKYQIFKKLIATSGHCLLQSIIARESPLIVMRIEKPWSYYRPTIASV